MGDLRAWSPERNGVVVVLEGRPFLSPSSPSVSSSSSVLFSSVNPEAEISAEYWQTAEVATQGIIARVQPTAVSEERRRAVIDYVQRLIKNSLGCEVFPFGSVPLKTYLPDGDIDLTAFGGMSLDEALANDVCSVLEREDKSGAGKFVVKDVQLIRAEVKLVKCLVQNIVVDISFNQLGGLCTLCFLEQVDRLIGKDHLFKRSITLVKAWCYYESRILGAHHGLISTYALETLVLYIFHLFHLSLNGPLAVLFKFLDYFSKFDWDNYCVSLNGPIRIGSLPVVVEAPEYSGCDLLLTNDFLNGCAQKFSVPARGFETNSRTFPSKHLNIVDPLKENNNLGRSVSKGNFYRIRSAFTYGARKLGRVLSQPEETVGAELCKFFSNTLDRHGSGQRPDVQDPLPVNEHCEFVATPLPAKESCPEDWTGLESSVSGGITADSHLDIRQSLQGGIDNVMISESEVNFHRMINETQSTVSGPAVSENRISGDAKDLATSRIQGPLALDKASKSDGVSSMGRPHHAPHLYLSSVDMKNGELRNGNTEWKHPESTSFSQNRISSWGPRRPGEKKVYFGSHDLDDNKVINMLEVRSPVGSINHPVLFRSVSWSSDDRYAGYSGNQASGSSAGKSEALNSMSDLTGDYESHLNNLYYGRCWYECAMNGSVPSMSPPLSAQFQGKSSWDVIRQSMQYTVKGISKMNVNGVASGPVFYPMKPHLLPNGTLGVEEMAKPRGTGTYFPNMNHYKDRPTTPRGRGQTSMRSPRSNGRNMTFQETYFPERQSRDSQVQLHFHQGGGKPVSSDLRHPAFTETKPHSNVNGSEHPSEVGLEFGPAEHLTNVAPPAESDRQPNSGSASTQSSGVSLLTEEIQIPKPALGMEQDGIAEQSYQLKDDDFPPLSDSSGKGLPIYLVKKHEEQNGEC